MSRYIGPSCRLCRREGAKLFLKGTNASPRSARSSGGPTPRASTARPAAAGGRPRNTPSQLREKQKVKRMYGLSEQPVPQHSSSRSPPSRASRAPTCWWPSRRRLDNVVYRMGFAASRKAARQLIRHGHVEVNGHRVNVPSFQVVPGKKCAWRPAARNSSGSRAAQELRAADAPVVAGSRSTPRSQPAGCTERPTREAIPINAQEQLIVELYSK